ncbi:MAG: hypothetical protein SWK90_04790 [Chloroflexota bacterium]|nr:hypothetical protein [Chloroflexota bacterium]
MMYEIPADITWGLNFGSIAAIAFLVANLYVMLHLVQMIIAPKSQWTWLNRMRKSWHYVHYIGNAVTLVVVVIHATLLGQFASVFHWVLIILLGWMVFAGVVMRFIKASPNFKKALRRFHAQWYMFVAILVLLIVAHLASLRSFAYPL